MLQKNLLHLGAGVVEFSLKKAELLPRVKSRRRKTNRKKRYVVATYDHMQEDSVDHPLF